VSHEACCHLSHALHDAQRFKVFGGERHEGGSVEGRMDGPGLIGDMLQFLVVEDFLQCRCRRVAHNVLKVHFLFF